MVKMKNLNRKGFVMTETLVVAVFIMGIFGIMYNNFYPLIGEYERREVFDDVDSKYGAFWIKRFIQHKSYNLTTADKTTINTNGYVLFSCNKIVDNDYRKTMCKRLLKELEVKDYNVQPKVYITQYNLTNFKNYVKADTNYTTFSGGFSDYVNFLPEYRVPSLNDASYRVLIEFDRYKNGIEFSTYSTIEVKK